MNFKTVIDWNAVGEKEQEALLMRPAVSASDKITAIVTEKGICYPPFSQSLAALFDEEG